MTEEDFRRRRVVLVIPMHYMRVSWCFSESQLWRAARNKKIGPLNSQATTGYFQFSMKDLLRHGVCGATSNDVFFTKKKFRAANKNFTCHSS